jgi:hypothetical protein
LRALPGYEPRPLPVADEHGPVVPPVRYGFRSFDRQWIIPDNRLINQPNPDLWEVYSQHQVYLTALSRSVPSSGPALTFTGLVPDHDHYKGSFSGRVFSLWLDRTAKTPNVSPKLLAYLGQRYRRPVGAQDLLAYIAAVAAQPAYTARFQADLVKPGLRIPLTADGQVIRRRRRAWAHGDLAAHLRGTLRRREPRASSRPATAAHRERAAHPNRRGYLTASR